MWEYGRTYEGRPLQLLAISAPKNIARLEAIRKERLRLADPEALSSDERERLVRDLPVVVWLAYGVHGNESSSAEAAMATAWVLASAGGDVAALLEEAIVLIDPLCNPDGRERYVHSFEQRTGSRPNPDPAAAEHFEPWPGGRTNHYLLDLNRDWAWASQQETRHRIAAYRQWEPQVYVDFHEMGSESTYFFPPAAEPIHPRIDRQLVSWLDTFGRANAQAFERQGWIYYTGENFDLFYPGYGDSYPSLRGAVGMTYEMAGGGRAGAALTLPDGSLLTLADRVARHLTTSLATVRTAAQNRRRLLEDYAAGRAAPRDDDGRTFLWPADQQEAGALADLLALHGVRVEQLAQDDTLPARPLIGPAAAEPSPRQFAAGTYAVSTAQPLGDLVAALMELEASMSPVFLERQRNRIEQDLSPEFYDITAWSLPLAFNVKTWVAAGRPRGLRPAVRGAGAGHRPRQRRAGVAGAAAGCGLLPAGGAAPGERRRAPHRAPVLHLWRDRLPRRHPLRAPRARRRRRGGDARRADRGERLDRAPHRLLLRAQGAVARLRRHGGGPPLAHRPGGRPRRGPDLLRLPLAPPGPRGRRAAPAGSRSSGWATSTSGASTSWCCPTASTTTARSARRPASSSSSGCARAACWWRSAARSGGCRSTS